MGTKIKITFKKDVNAAIFYDDMGNININPDLIVKYGYLDITINGEINIQPRDFIFDCMGKAAAIQIE